jgi:hypothetical protein
MGIIPISEYRLADIRSNSITHSICSNSTSRDVRIPTKDHHRGWNIAARLPGLLEPEANLNGSTRGGKAQL